jgi:hypothetical protein
MLQSLNDICLRALIDEFDLLNVKHSSAVPVCMVDSKKEIIATPKKYFVKQFEINDV